MDFNTESGDRGGSGRSPGGPGGPPPRVSGGVSGGEFNYQDPVQSFINAVRGVVTAPVGFFRGIRREGDFVNPLIFAVICYEVSAILGGLLSLVGVMGTKGFGSFLVGIILAPIGAARNTTAQGFMKWPSSSPLPLGGGSGRHLRAARVPARERRS